MNKVTILIGPPGSGKSTFAKSLEDKEYIRISQDDQGKDGHLELFHTHITTGRDIVIDRMNFDKTQRDRYKLEAIKNGYTVNFVEFIVPRQVCYDRCMDRQGHPTITESKHAISALDTYFRFYQEVSDEEGELQRIQYETENKSDAIMVDLDGTLCNLDHRLHYVKGEGKKDWNKFFKECIYDLVYEDVKSVMESEMLAGTNIVLCSGRPSDYQDKTEEWLALNKINYTSLKMRPKMNYTRDDNVKAMLYRYEIKPYYNVKYVLDDRDQVVKKWRDIGLTCFQVRPGNF